MVAKTISLVIYVYLALQSKYSHLRQKKYKNIEIYFHSKRKI